MFNLPDMSPLWEAIMRIAQALERIADAIEARNIADDVSVATEQEPS